MTDEARSNARGHASDAEQRLSALYKSYFSTLCIFVRRRFGSGPPDPEDAVQAAFTQFAALKDTSGIENPKGFLYRSACNFVLDYRRRDTVAAKAVRDISTISLGLAPADDDALRVIEGRESLAAVSAAIEALDSRRRDVLVMHSIDGLTCAEIARRLKISPTRVTQLYADAIAACARAIRASDVAGKN